MGTEMTGPGLVEATQKSLEILASVKKVGPATVTELAERLGYSKSTIHRHILTLEDAGYLVEGEEGYRIGLVYLDYGIHARDQEDLYRVTKPKLDELADEIGEKVWSVVAENGYGVFVGCTSGRHAVRTYTRVGYRLPLHTFAGGKAILAFMDDEEIQRIVERRGLPPNTEHSITDPTALFETVEQIRERGVAFSREETIEGIHAVAVPIRSKDGTPLGSISVAGPANRVKGSYYEEEIPELLLGVANELEVGLAFD